MNETMTKNWKKWPAAIAAAALIAAAPLLAEQKSEEKFEKTVALNRTGKLFLNNLSGRIEIMTWKDAQVKIEALKISKADTVEKARENAAQVTIEVGGDANRVSVEVKYPKRTAGFWGGDSLKVSVDFKVWVPEQAAIDLKSVSGDIRVAPLGGPAKIKCVSGDVDLRGATGADIDLVSGSLTLANIAGDVFLKAISGNIGVTAVKGSVAVEAVSGDIELLDVSEAAKINAKSINGNIVYAGAIRAGGRYELKAHSGDVRMTVPAASTFDFEANTFSGTIDSGFDVKVVGKISTKEIRGTVGGGGATVILKTFSGNIDLIKK